MVIIIQLIITNTYLVLYLIIFNAHTVEKRRPLHYAKNKVTMGFEKQILKEGTGPAPTRGKSVTVHCTGYGKNGDMNVKFWSTKGY